ncbi:hypothetical protein ACFFMN_34010 [Planobispora siamensis]|uniref:Uncharacterized protein n=1 Tax=Planobispora siamensis TaxID=936338 RepID=A0A8J3SC39_9ACTN|nr:hypothetical protein [Planobispora siamensis]GIH91931.1 hypothetical protein Psi01_25610 [Planobispora siamensis]
MPLKDFTHLERLSAADMNRYFMQQAHVIKGSDESLASSTTLQNDNELLLPVAAGTSYWVQGFIIYSALAAADLKISFAGPAGSTFDYVSDAVGSGATAGVSTVSRSLQSLGSAPAPGGIGSGLGNALAFLPKGVMTVGGTAGNLQLQWAQLAASATATVVHARSVLIIRRLTD